MKVSGSRGRRGISEFMGALIMIAITLVAGSAAFGWIILESGTSESAYGNSAAASVNFLNERFTLVAQAYYGTGNTTCPASAFGPNFPGECNLASFWLFNTGKVDFTLSSIQLKSLTTSIPPDGNALDIIFTSTGFTVNKPALSCPSNTDAGDGFPLAINGFKSPGLLGQQVLSTPYRISMPTCTGGIHLFLFDGTTYMVTLTGLYGNVVTQSFTPNG